MESAYGPVSSIRLGKRSGRVPSFFSRTAARAAAIRTISRASSVGSRSSESFVHVRIVEQPQRILQFEHARDGIVHARWIDRLGRGRDLRWRAAHLDVEAGRVGRVHRVREILRDSVRQQVAHTVGIPDDHARESPLALQHLGQKGAVRVHRHARDGVERRHDGCRARRDGGPEGFEVDVAESVLRDVDGVVIASALGLTVGDEVLGGGCDRIARCEVVALVAADHRSSENGRQVDVLAEALDRASPAWVARDVDHRRERPGDAGRASLGRRQASESLDDGRVERRGHRQGHRSDRPMTVDHVESDQNRDAEPGLLDGDPLQLVRRRGGPRPEHRPDAVSHEGRGILLSWPEDDLQLPELLSPRHRSQQRAYSCTRHHVLVARLPGAGCDAPQPRDRGPWAVARSSE